MKFCSLSLTIVRTPVKLNYMLTRRERPGSRRMLNSAAERSVQNNRIRIYNIHQCTRRYSTIERELVALRWDVKVFRAFFYGIKFIIFTDHKPLLYLQNMAKENSRLMRTLLISRNTISR